MDAAQVLARDADAEAFFDKWRNSWPALGAARLFASENEWPRLRARVGVSFEIAEASWLLTDATVREHKLMWWHEELQRHAQGQARHPLLLAAPALMLSPRIVAAALASLHESAPADASQTLTRVTRLAAHATDAEVGHVAGQLLLAAVYLLALRAGRVSAFAHAPLDLRARFAVADAAGGMALASLSSALAAAWQGELSLRFTNLSRRDWQGSRGLRVLSQLALDLIHGLARGREPSGPNVLGTVRAWACVVGLR